MKFFILGEYYKGLIPWLKEDLPPSGMPSVSALYEYLGNSEEHRFYSIIFNPDVSRKKYFPNGSVIQLIRFRFPVYLLWKFIVYFRLLYLGNKMIKKGNYDVVYGLSTFSSIAAFLGKRHGIFSVSRIYGTILTKKVEKGQYWQLYTRHIFEILAIKNPGDLFLCTKDGTQFDKIARHFNSPRPVTMMYNGMDAELKQKLLEIPLVGKLPESGLRMCYIARIEPYKQQILALEVVEELVNRYNRLDIQLNILGTGSQEEKLKQWVKKQGLEKQIQFIPEIPHREILPFLAKHHISIFFYEGGNLGNAMWESALSGRLIITNDSGNTGALFKDGINCLLEAEGAEFAKNMARKINEHLGKDVSNITKCSRKDIDGVIDTWEARLEKEMSLIQCEND